MAELLAFLKAAYHKLPRPPSTLYCVQGPGINPMFLLPDKPVIYDIGSKERLGAYFGATPPGARIVCVDIEDRPGVDLVADAHDLHMVPDASVDLVITKCVLEHVRYPAVVVGEIFRILKPGGIVFIDVPFIFPFHADPHDFYRFSYLGLPILCEKFECLESGYSRGPASTIHHLLVHFLAILFSFNSQTLYGINVDLFKWMLFWVKYLDKFIGRYSMAYVIHSGSYFTGRKPF